jgi:hypothetical protein
MSTFQFTAHDPEHGHTIARIEADNEREARGALKSMIFCRKLSAHEIIQASQRGLAIVDAKTGKVIGGDQDQDADNTGGTPLGSDAE